MIEYLGPHFLESSYIYIYMRLCCVHLDFDRCPEHTHEIREAAALFM